MAIAPPQEKLAAFDYETFYTKEFSLSKMTNEEYVSSPQFDTICVSLWVPEWGTEIKVVWGSVATLRAAILALIPDIEERLVLAWNAKFDGAVTEWLLGIFPKGWLCVMSMFGAMYGMGSACSLKKAAEFLGLPPKLDGLQRMGARHSNMSDAEKAETTTYCTHDNRLNVMIFFELLKDGFPENELPVLSATDQCYLRSPIVLDIRLASTALVAERERRAKILADLNVPAEALRSEQQFAELLRAEGVEPPLKVSPSNPEKLIHAFAKTDEEFTDLRLHENPRVAALVDARLGIRSSIIETRLERLLDISTRGNIPIPITYAGARVTQRWAASENEATNMQNLKRGSVLREVMCAPAGMQLVAVDLSGIELRVARWLAANWYEDATAISTLQMIREGGDIYCNTASRAYGRPVTKADKMERQAGKETELSCQFRVGHVKLNQRLRTTWGVYLDPGMDKVLVDTFRSDNEHGVVQAWKDLDEALKLMADGGATDKFWPFLIDGEHVDRPSGLSLWYPGLTYEAGKYGPQAVYFKTKGRSTEKCYLHGGSLFNNCLAAGTLVLTKRGWVEIENVRPTDHVHDGENWTSHGGSVYKSTSNCTVIDGVFMTYDHEVLTSEGWRAASTNPKPYRPSVWPFDCTPPSAQQRTQEVVGDAVQVRHVGHSNGGRRAENSKARELPLLWLHALRSIWHTPYVWAAGIHSVPQHAGTMHQPQREGVQKLWRAGHQGLRALASVVREFLGRHGSSVDRGADLGSQRQRAGVQPRELSMGVHARAEHEQAHQQGWGGHPSVVSTNGDFSEHTVLSGQKGATPRAVYDIMNAGPLHRFVVLGNNGPFIVHNCVQSLSRDIMSYGWRLLLKQDPIYHPIMTVHDELISCVPDSEVDNCIRIMSECMTTLPKWARLAPYHQLPLAVEANAGQNYKECK